MIERLLRLDDESSTEIFIEAISERSGERRMMLSNLDSPYGVLGPVKKSAWEFQSGQRLLNGSASADGNLEGYDLVAWVSLGG